MATVYKTIQGDTWDMIAYKHFSRDQESQAGRIMAANFPLLDYFVFPAGVLVVIPDAQEEVSDLPPWRR